MHVKRKAFDLIRIAKRWAVYAWDGFRSDIQVMGIYMVHMLVMTKAAIDEGLLTYAQFDMPLSRGGTLIRCAHILHYLMRTPALSIFYNDISSLVDRRHAESKADPF